MSRQKTKYKTIKIIFLVLFIVLASWLYYLDLKKIPLSDLPWEAQSSSTETSNNSNPVYDEVAAKVIPREGFKTSLILGDTYTKLLADGIIDEQKFNKIYTSRGLTQEKIAAFLANNPNQTIIIDSNNASLWLNIFWAVGLANKTEFNKESPINGPDLDNFASTAGWTLGKENSGGKYFNQHELIKLTADQEKIVLKVAENSYRPCCDNSTFFQDCNHGSALLGALELAASQGLNEDELFNLTVKFNSFWFSDQYIETALYFKMIKNQNWEDVSAKTIMSSEYSSSTGWVKNVAREIQKIPNLLPKTKNAQQCSI